MRTDVLREELRMAEPVWKVARDVLREAGRPLHYEEITKRVLASGRTLLGTRGNTPEQTVGAILRSRDIFSRFGGGLYALCPDET